MHTLRKNMSGMLTRWHASYVEMFWILLVFLVVQKNMFFLEIG